MDHYGVAAMEAVRQRRAVISYSDGGLAGYRPAAATSGGQYGKLDEGALARALVDALSGAELRLTGAVDTIGDAVAGRILLAYEGAV